MADSTSSVTLATWPTYIEIHGTATTRAMSISCNADAEYFIATTLPATTKKGHLLKANELFTCELTGDENLYGRSKRALLMEKTV